MVRRGPASAVGKKQVVGGNKVSYGSGDLVFKYAVSDANDITLMNAGHI